MNGDRYEYETNMLLALNGYGIKYHEHRIETVYIEENQTSHFRPVRDSLRIYALILKFLLSSGAATIIDLLLFYLLSRFLPSGKYVTLEATVMARIVSSLVNFSINRNVVFRQRRQRVEDTFEVLCLCHSRDVRLRGRRLSARAYLQRECRVAENDIQDDN